MRALITTILLGIVTLLIGQQEPQYSNYQMNNFMLNPAVAGSYNFWNVKAGFMSQWVGMQGGPKTFFATLHGPIHFQKDKRFRRKKQPHHGLGVSAFHDNAGAISYNGVMGTYAFHARLNRRYTLSIGASFGIKEFRLDASKLKFVETGDDPELTTSIYSDMSPDVNLGFWLYSKNMFFGASARQVLQSDINISAVENINSDELSKLHNHYFITAGTRLDINHTWAFIPSVMVQVVTPAPVQIDLNGTFWFQETFAFGLSYRHLDALYVILDYVHDEKLEIGYAFDLTLSELQKYNSGSHEIIVSYRFNAQRNKVRCPAKFW